jgi:hypothetical protein
MAGEWECWAGAEVAKSKRPTSKRLDFMVVSWACLQPYRRGGALRIREGAAGALLTLRSIGRNGTARRFTDLAIINLRQVWAGWEERKRNAEAPRALRREAEEKGIYREKKKAGLVNARRRNAAGAELGRSVLRPYNGKPATRIFRS